MVTARTEDQDAVRGLNTGADDYIAKPFNMEALLARMRALLRRSAAAPARGQLEFHDIVMDLVAHRVQRNGRAVHLGPTEFRLLEFLMQHPRRVFSREELLNGVWGRDSAVALERYQRGQRLPATGQLNPATAAALGINPADVLPPAVTVPPPAAATFSGSACESAPPCTMSSKRGCVSVWPPTQGPG